MLPETQRQRPSLSYRTKPCMGKIMGFRAEESPEQRSRCPWKDFASSGVEVYIVPGNCCITLQEPRVRDLTGRLASRLDGEFS